jgi:ABC-type bacteriocin/lantibiotic exporter with double-glycine peptidase domain
MIAAYWQQPLLQDDIANWLHTSAIGTPSNRIRLLEPRGFAVTYGTGSLTELSMWLDRKIPCILFVRTIDLAYWKIDTPHAVVLIGIEADRAYLLDPAIETSPAIVTADELLLAWSHSEYTFATLLPH